MKIPTELKHKPIVVSEDYDKIDGRRANNSDAEGLSLGLAQWNERGNVDISAKVWRHTGGKWSRQSEELPLHRVLDLAILIIKTRKVFSERYHKNEKTYPNFPLLDRIGLQGGAMNISVCTENEQVEGDWDLFEAALAKDDEIISERLATLAVLIEELKK